MDFSIRYSEQKNQLLKATRGISFLEIIRSMEEGQLLDDTSHPNRSRPNQRTYIVRVGDYVYVVPYVVNVERKEIFSKTIYPSRVLTKIYLKGGKKNEK